jgi:hypothetical protein
MLKRFLQTGVWVMVHILKFGQILGCHVKMLLIDPTTSQRDFDLVRNTFWGIDAKSYSGHADT